MSLKLNHHFQQMSRQVLNLKQVLAERQVTDSTFRLGEWLVEPVLDRISRGDLRVNLQPQVMDLLVYLAHHRRKVVGTEELLSHIWEGRVVTSASVYSCLKQLRDSLGDDPHDPRYIQTVPKRGYRLIADVEFPRVEKPGPTAAQTIAAKHRLSVQPRRLTTVLALIGFAAIVYVGVAFHPKTPDAGRSLLDAVPARSLAVLPFTDMSPERDQGWFCDGIAEEILNKLAQLPGLKVSGRTSSFAFREPDVELTTIANTLGVAHLLEGSVRREGDRVRVTAQLLNARDGFHLWSKEYDRDVGDIFTVQDDIASNIAAALQLQLAGGASATGQASLGYYPSFTAYELYLQGRELIAQQTGDSLQGALVKLEKALEIEPDFAAAHLAMAETYGLLYQSLTFYQGDSIEESRALMGPHLEKALALDPNLAEAYVIQTWLSDDDDDEALYRKALALNPNLASAHRELGINMANDWYSWNEALAEVGKSLELEPLSLENASVLTEFLQFVPGRSDEVPLIIENLKNRHPGHPIVARLEGEWLLNQGLLAAAVPQLEKSVLADPDNFQPRFLLNIAWFALGEMERALEAPYWQRQWRLVLAPDREDSLAQLAAQDYSGSMEFSSRMLSAYVYLMLRDWQAAVDVLADYTLDLQDFRQQCEMSCGKRYSPALTLATAFSLLGDEERFRQFAEIDRFASNTRWENGKIHNFEYSRTMARLNALEGRPYEAMLELERLLATGPIDPRELLHPAFDELRGDARFAQLEDLQRARVNIEREKLGMAPLPVKGVSALVQVSD